MPATQEREFSFEKDVAPYASKHFDRISADPNLTGSQKRELQGMLLGGADSIRQQQMKLKEDQQQGRMRDLQYATGVSALEEARARRARMEASSGEVARSQSVVQSIFSEAASPEEKRRRLGEFQVANAATLALNPDAKQVFDIANSALPKDCEGRLTASQRARFAAAKVPQEILDTEDPVLIGQKAAEIADYDAQLEYAEKLKRDQTEAGIQMKLKLAQETLKFAKSDETGEDSDWLEPNSTMKATVIVGALGTPEEQARFEKLKGASSDRDRADLIEKIQLREQLKAVRGGVTTAKDRAMERMFGK